MMMKIWVSSAAKILLNSSINTGPHQHQLIDRAMLAPRLSSVSLSKYDSSKGIHNTTTTLFASPNPVGKPGQNPEEANHIDTPFAGIEPRAPNTPIPVKGPNDESSSSWDEDASYFSSSLGNDTRDNQKSKTEEMTDYVTDKAKRGTKGAVETAFDVGAAMAEGMEHTWSGVKQTTHKVKDAILGRDEDDDEGRGQGRGGEREDGGHGDHRVDKHVEDLRRKAGGYDVGPR